MMWGMPSILRRSEQQMLNLDVFLGFGFSILPPVSKTCYDTGMHRT